MKVPFLDLRAQYQSVKKEIDDAIGQVIEKCAFAGGPFVEKFENEFAQFCGSDHAIGVGSGTEALWLSLLALGVGTGDEVITVPNTFIATAEAISLCGATPVFVDIDEKTYNMDVHKLEAVISRKTKAILPVHLYGQMADMNPIMKIANKYKLYVIEDACQAHGAKYHGKNAGTIGDAGCFSFYPGKNLGAYGDAGALVTNNAVLADKVRLFRDHGQSKKYYHELIGLNGRMDGIQGAILSVKLKHLTKWTEQRRANAKIYSELLQSEALIKLPDEGSAREHVYHIYPIRTKNRDAIQAELLDKQIETGIHYPIPIHLQNAYSAQVMKDNSFPVCEKITPQLLSLPMFPELTLSQIEYVCHELQNSVR